MTILSSVKTFIKTYPGIVSSAPVTSDHTGSTNIPWYSINPISGNPVIETYINGSQRRQFPFVLQSNRLTMDELERLDNISFFESFAEWLDDQTNAGSLPTLESGKTPLAISAVDWAYLFEQGESGTGIYQIRCQLEYKKDA